MRIKIKPETLIKSFKVALTSLAITVGSYNAANAAETLRLSTAEPPESGLSVFAKNLAERVEARTNGEVRIKVYPASQLGDWVEIHEQMMEGTVDMSVQWLSNNFNDVVALQWFPYTVTNFEEARKSFAPGGVIFNTVNDAIADQDLEVLGSYVVGAGGLLYSNPPENPRDINTSKDRKIRVWPGGTTHQALLKRLGHQTAPIPWAEAYTAMQTGVVDGLIGSTPEQTLTNFIDVTKMWVQNNDHFEVALINMNKTRLDGLSDEARKAIRDVAQEMTRERFDIAQQEHERLLQEMRDRGVEVIVLSDSELAELAQVVRTEVWPDIADEIGAKNLANLKQEMGIK